MVGERGGVEGSMAYRSVQADVAAALHTGNTTAGNQLRHAHLIVSAYPQVHAALAEGVLSAAHARVIADAGRVIGAECVADSPDDAARRAQYETRVVEKAIGAMARLRKLAKQLQTIEEKAHLDDVLDKSTGATASGVPPSELATYGPMPIGVDHTIEYSAGGPTTITNMGHLCRDHHLLKHHGGWNLTQHRRARPPPLSCRYNACIALYRYERTDCRGTHSVSAAPARAAPAPMKKQS